MTDRPEPIAIIGIAALYPGARGADALWRLISDPQPPPRGSGAALGELEIDVARFGIPPVQIACMTRMQVLMLEAARQCLIDAGYSERPMTTERTDVVVGVGTGLDRQYANALRIEASRYARDLETESAVTDAAAGFRARLPDRLAASPHDRVGEMASTIPARIASVFGLRGRTLALESAEATSFVAVAHAMNCLRAAVSDAALVLTGQRDESPLLAASVAAKGAAVDGPAAHDGGAGLGEGVGGVLLKRLSSARRDGDRIYATLLDCSVGHHGRSGTFRPSLSVERRTRLTDASLRLAAVSPASVQYVERAGDGTPAATGAAVEALSATLHDHETGSVPLGNVADRLGHTFANAGLAGLSKVVLSLYHRTLPPHSAAPDPAPAGIELAGTPLRLQPGPAEWPVGAAGAPRRAIVLGESRTGTLGQIVLEECGRVDPDGGVGDESGRIAEPIAVIGLGGRFAGSPDAPSFWSTMLSGRDRIGPLPAELLDRALYHAPEALSLAHSYTDIGAPMAVPSAPPGELRITPRRFADMDAAQRVGLTVGAELMAGLGRGAATLSGRGVVAVGSPLSLAAERAAYVDHSIGELETIAGRLPELQQLSGPERSAVLARVRHRFAGDPGEASPHRCDGYLASGIAATLANEYGLDAVPVAVEAACASSLAAIDLAVAALRAATVDYAIAGGVELACTARDLVLCCGLGLLSRTRITPFDRAADGFTPGDGCALFALKRLSDARRDGDRVVAVLSGIGASNDAKSLIAPDVDGQVRAMERAFDQVAFDAAAVDYLEAHGTGTRVGDPVEIAATARVYAKPRRRRPLAIGSAKSFVGHTFAAAGGAGLLRVVQAMQAATLPPNTNLDALNPDLVLDDIPAVIGTRPAAWPVDGDAPRRAAVSSFGTGGINYHLLVEEPTDGAP